MTYRNQISSGTIANIPPSNKIGGLYLPTSGGALYQNNGTSWQSWAQSYPIIIPTATNTNFGWVNQHSSTMTYTSSGLLVTVPGFSGSQPSIIQNNPNITSGFIEVGALSLTTGALTSGSAIYMQWGIVMLSGTTYVELGLNFNINNANNISFIIYEGTNINSGSVVSNSLVPMSGPVFLKLAIVGSNLLFQMSRDRVNYVQVFSIALSTAFGTLSSSTFTVGVGVATVNSTAYTNNTLIFHYLQG